MPKDTGGGKNATIRAFVAIKLPDKLMVKLKEVRDTLASSQKDVSWVRPGGIHLTLKFLGDIETEEVDKVAEALFLAAKGVKAFTLKAQGVGGFPNLKSPRVIWVGIRESNELLRLQKNIDDRLFESGFEKDDRPFNPHLTLARVKTPGAGRELGKRVEESKIDIDVDFRADYFVLFRSVLSPKGAEYTELRRFDLE
jgi:2'-5' RNA ligase